MIAGLLVGAVSLLIGFVAFTAGLFRLLVLRDLRRRHRTEGLVIRHLERPSSDNSTFSAVVEYHVGDLRFEFTSTTATSPRLYRDGQRVPVCYDPARPEAAEIDTPAEWAVAWYAFAAGLTFIGFAIWAVLYLR